MSDKTFTIEGRKVLSNQSIQNQNLWELFIPNTNLISPLLNYDEEDLTVSVREITLPSITIETYEAQHLGLKKIIPIKKDLGNSFSIQVESFENQKTISFFINWCNLIINTDTSLKNIINSNIGSMSILFPISNMLKRKITLIEYAYNGDDLKYRFEFFNAYPKKIDLGNRNYETSGSVKYNIEFSFDTIEFNKSGV